jgi:uncharacterized protein DUF6174
MRYLVSAVMSATFTWGCSSLGEYVERADAWQSQGNESYVWTVEASEPVFGPRRITVRVVDGQPIRASADGKRVPVVDGSANDVPATVDAVFDWLIRSADDAISVKVLWSDAGYPARIRIDFSDAIDDEVSFRVVRFAPLESG